MGPWRVSLSAPTNLALPSAPCEEVRGTFSTNSEDAGHVFRMAYLTAYEKATGAVFGERSRTPA